MLGKSLERESSKPKSSTASFGYLDTFKLNWMKGKDIRKVKSQVKTEVLVGIVRGKSVVVGVNTGEAYSD
jgi:hypothetical protein